MRKGEPEPRLTISVMRREQLTAELLSCVPARVLVPLEILEEVSSLPPCPAGVEWCVLLPRVWRDRDEPGILRMLDHAAALGAAGAMLGNIGHIPLMRERKEFRWYGDYGLNVYNSWSLQYLEEKGLSSACVSFELRMAQIRELEGLSREAIVYGRLPLMVTENRPCVDGYHCGKSGGNSGKEGGTRGKTGEKAKKFQPPSVLTDRTGARFPMLPVWGGRTELQNSVPLWLADRTHWKRAGLSYARLRFTVEDPEECVRVLRAYQRGDAPSGPFTRGLYERGVA